VGGSVGHYFAGRVVALNLINGPFKVHYTLYIPLGMKLLWVEYGQLSKKIHCQEWMYTTTVYWADLRMYKFMDFHGPMQHYTHMTGFNCKKLIFWAHKIRAEDMCCALYHPFCFQNLDMLWIYYWFQGTR